MFCLADLNFQSQTLYPVELRALKSGNIHINQLYVSTKCKANMKINRKIGVTDGARTHDNRSHSPGLYQLSYSHHKNLITIKNWSG